MSQQDLSGLFSRPAPRNPHVVVIIAALATAMSQPPEKGGASSKCITWPIPGDLKVKLDNKDVVLVPELIANEALFNDVSEGLAEAGLSGLRRIRTNHEVTSIGVARKTSRPRKTSPAASA